MKPEERVEGKKSYSTPQLHIYGQIRDITKNVVGLGMDDGGGKGVKT